MPLTSWILSKAEDFKTIFRGLNHPTAATGIPSGSFSYSVASSLSRFDYHLFGPREPRDFKNNGPRTPPPGLFDRAPSPPPALYSLGKDHRSCQTPRPFGVPCKNRAHADQIQHQSAGGNIYTTTRYPPHQQATPVREVIRRNEDEWRQARRYEQAVIDFEEKQGRKRKFEEDQVPGIPKRPRRQFSDWGTSIGRIERPCIRVQGDGASFLVPLNLGDPKRNIFAHLDRAALDLEEKIARTSRPPTRLHNGASASIFSPTYRGRAATSLATNSLPQEFNHHHTGSTFTSPKLRFPPPQSTTFQILNNTYLKNNYSYNSSTLRPSKYPYLTSCLRRGPGIAPSRRPYPPFQSRRFRIASSATTPSHLAQPHQSRRYLTSSPTPFIQTTPDSSNDVMPGSTTTSPTRAIKPATATPLKPKIQLQSRITKPDRRGRKAPLPDQVRDQISNVLYENSSTSADLQSTLLLSLRRKDWARKVKIITRELLRSGKCTTYDEIMAVIMAASTQSLKPTPIALEAEEREKLKKRQTEGDISDNDYDSDGQPVDESGKTRRRVNTKKILSELREEGIDVDIGIPPETVQEGVGIVKNGLDGAIIWDDLD